MTLGDFTLYSFGSNEEFSGYSNLKKDLDISPFSAKWDLQSVPTVSQIFVTYLRDNFDFDGVFYPSTKGLLKNKMLFFALRFVVGFGWSD